jgi:hypothetical protein
MTSGLSWELELLACAARVRLEPPQQARIGALLRRPGDWHRLLRAAERHKLVPLLARHLDGGAGEVPEEVRRRLRVAAFDSAWRTLVVADELLELLLELEARGILAVPYKGLALAAQLYGNVALRPPGDLDLLVRRADVAAARALLLERGYYARHPVSGGAAAFMLRSRYGEIFDHPVRETVELHWGFADAGIGLSLDLEALEPHLEVVSLGGRSVPAFGREDLLLVLCVHGAKHRWDRLEWFCGVAETVRSSPALRWDALLERATALGVRRMLLLGLLLAHDLLEAPVPGAVLRQARADAATARLAAGVPAILESEPLGAGAVSLPTDLWTLQLRERWRDRLRFVWYRLATPSQPERWAALTIGARVVPLHGFVRPFRLALRAAAILRDTVAPGLSGPPTGGRDHVRPAAPGALPAPARGAPLRRRPR